MLEKFYKKLKILKSGSPKAEDFIPRPTAEDEARNRAVDEQTRQVRDLADKDPETMSKLLRGWLIQGNDSQPDDKEESESSGDIFS